jgi:hypothetical protein
LFLYCIERYPVPADTLVCRAVQSHWCPALGLQTQSYQEQRIYLYTDAGEEQVPGTWWTIADLLRIPVPWIGGTGIDSVV